MELKDLILESKQLWDAANDINLEKRYEAWCGRVRNFMDEKGWTEGEQAKIKVKMHYAENEYSPIDTAASLKKAARAIAKALEENCCPKEERLTKSTAIMLAEKILNNFYMYYKAMYKAPTHKNGILSLESLSQIQIGNEYDLQRMLYALLRPVFPTIRQETVNDNGYSGMRADLYLEEYDLIIETKCTRESLSEKKLIEELGADGFHYKADTLFFFVYDKSCVIKNPEAFKAAFERDLKKNGKTIKVIIFQPIEL